MNRLILPRKAILMKAMNPSWECKGCGNLEIEISSQLYELLLIQAAEAGLTVEELNAYAFGNYMEKE